jgi:chromosome segregation ATPase
MAPSTGTILCSNCRTETVPTEKLKTCGFCSQRVSPRYGGQAAEDKQVKLKQASVRNDPNLVKAATNPNRGSSGEVYVGTQPPPNQPPPSGQTIPPGPVNFSSSEWRELNASGERQMLPPDPKKTQAFELLAELKKEIEPEMQGVTDAINKAQEASSIVDGGTMQPHAHAPTAHSGNNPAAAAELTLTNPAANAHFGGSEAQAELTEKLHAVEAQLNGERLERQRAAQDRDQWQQRHDAVAAQVGVLQEQLNSHNPKDEQLHELQGKVAELASLLAADKRAKEQLLRERAEIEELYREGEAKVAELSTRISSDATARGSIIKERDDLREFRRELEARLADLVARFDSEKQARDHVQRERDALADTHKDLSAKVADLTSRIASDRNVRASGFHSNEELEAIRQESEARIADLETRLAAERRTKETLIKDRDQLSDSQRELQARIADLETRLHSEREAKEAHAAKHFALIDHKGELEARNADLESRLGLEKEAKESAAEALDKLHAIRQELEAKTADLGRRHATEREARELALKEHGLLQNEHRELSARSADLKARLKAEQDIKDTVRKERDDAISRADGAEVRAERAEAEIGRLRKGLAFQLDKLSAEYNVILSRLATKVAELSTHAKFTRKRLEEEAVFQGDKIENAALDLKARLESESIEVGQRMKKLLSDGEFNARDSARFAVLTPGSNPPAPPTPATPSGSGSQPAPDAAAEAAPGGAKRVSGRLISGKHPTLSSASASATDGTAADETGPVEAVDARTASGSRQPVIADGGDPKEDKTSGTFWAKVFKRPATKS